MEVIVPENIQDITLEQYQKFNRLNKKENVSEYEYSKQLVSIFTNVKYNDCDKIKRSDFKGLTEDILSAMNQEAKFMNRFAMDGKEFGFIPNFDDITFSEWVDLNNYKHDDVENYHKLVSILFRPIINNDKLGNYSIESYSGTAKYSELMKHTPMNIVNGCLVFFSSLANELLSHSQRSTTVQQVKGIKR